MVGSPPPGTVSADEGRGAHALHERLEEPGGDRPDGAVTEGSAVEAGDRLHVGGGAGEEELLEPAELVGEDGVLAVADPKLTGEAEHHVARDAGEDVVR